MERASTQSSDEELAGRAQAGSLEAFEELLYRYEGRIFRFLVQSCGNPSDAADLAQEAFVTAYRKLNRYDPKQAFAPWLFTLARRKWIDWARRQRPMAEVPVPEIPGYEDPASLLSQQEEQDQIWETAHTALTEQQFQALWLRYAEQMPVEQVARVLRRTRIHVRVMLFRARTKLARKLTETERLSHRLVAKPGRLKEVRLT